jgi:pimeloyl-ACP methyl ester carboxylesterase
MRRRALLPAALILSAVVVALSVPSAASAEGSDPSWATCAQYLVPVTVSATDATPYNVSGRLCLRDDSARGLHTVEMFVSGLTYDHNYFNASYQPNTYSYIYAATSRGYSTFNWDRLGVGLSDHPPSAKLTLQSHAYVTAQIVQKLRAGLIGGRAFTTVVGVGHSFGAAVLQYLAGTTTVPANAPDYLILAGFLFNAYAPGLTQLGGSLYTATSPPGPVRGSLTSSTSRAPNPR